MPNSTAIPSLVYKDPLPAIEFLVRAFGFERNAVYEDAGVVAHAQLTFPGGGMVMIGTYKPGSPTAAHLVHPADIAGKNTGGIYLITPDCQAAYARALAAGALITAKLTTMDYGCQAFSAKDPEGYHWSFGSYDPWAS